MKNISFDNPYLLLLAIPAILLVAIPFFLIINKDNKTIGWKLSLGLHIVIIVLVCMAVAGLSSSTVLTKTSVYVVADVSYSSERNLDEIDGYVEQINGALPENSKLGVICFGKNSVQLTPLGRTLRSVKEAKVDASATNIVAALDYTGQLLSNESLEDSIKRVVLITDGNDTVGHTSGELAAAVARLKDAGVKVDTIYLNNALGEGDSEIQLTDVSLSSTAYLGQKSVAKLSLNTSLPTNARVELFARDKNDSSSVFESLGYTVEILEAGLTTLDLTLPTSQSGSYEYRVTVTGENDHSEHNNSYLFTQTVVGKVKILHITGSPADVDLLNIVYGTEAEIDPFVVSGSKNNVPITVEQLIKYDEIVISNVDIRNINNVNALIDSLDTVVAQFGKSLITFGDLNMQTDREDPVFTKFSELLPVNYGSASQAGKLYTIVLDVSHSMFYASKHLVAKEAAIKLLSIMDPDDYVCLITFSGNIRVQAPALVKNCRQEMVDFINKSGTEHGTDIGLGLEEALKTIQAMNLQENQVMLISDGFSFDNTVNAIDAAKALFDAGTPVSTVCTYIPSDGYDGRTAMQNIAAAGTGGKSYILSRTEDVSQLIFGSLSNDLTQSVVNANSTVNINLYKDPAVAGIPSLPNVSTYIQSSKKYDATVPLTVNYIRPSGYAQSVPLYAYRSHGNGKVSTFTSSLADSWCSKWSADVKTRFVKNMLGSNTPAIFADHPYTVSVSYDAQNALIEIRPVTLNPGAETKIVIRDPNGLKKTEILSFDSSKYTHTFKTEKQGTFTVDITYSYDGKSFPTSVSFVLPYLPEYNAFANFDRSVVHKFMRGLGTVSEGEIPSLENDEKEISTYNRSYNIPLLIAAMALFVVDIIVRKFKITNKKRKEAGK